MNGSLPECDAVVRSKVPHFSPALKHEAILWLLLRQTSGTSQPAASRNLYFCFHPTLRNTTLLEFFLLPLWTIVRVSSMSRYQKCIQTATPFLCYAGTLVPSFSKRKLPRGCCDQPIGMGYLGHQPHSSSAVRPPRWSFITGAHTSWQPRACCPQRLGLPPLGALMLLHVTSHQRHYLLL